MKEKIDATKAIQLIAKKEGITVDEVRKEMELAMLAGLCSLDREIRTRWRRVPRKGETPTPEELIAYLAATIDAGIEPFV